MIDDIPTDLQAAQDEIRRLRRHSDYMGGLLHEIAESGVEFDDPRLRYVVVQIDKWTWESGLEPWRKLWPTGKTG